MDAQADEASIFHQAALDNAREQSDVDISTADEDRDLLALQRPFAVKDGGDGGSSGTLGHSLVALQQQEDRGRDFFLLDRDGGVDTLLNRTARALRPAPDRNSVRN